MRRTIAALPAFVILLAAGTAFGQAQRGALTVFVLSTEGEPLPGAMVSAESAQTLTRRSGNTNLRGRVGLIGLEPAADYVLTTRLDGYNSALNDNVQIRAGQDFPIRVVLGMSASPPRALQATRDSSRRSTSTREETSSTPSWTGVVQRLAKAWAETA